MPSFGDLFTDLRGEDRTMRVSFHSDRDAVVLSLWSGTFCRGSFRMPTDDVDRLMAFLTEVRRATARHDEPTGSGTAAVGAPVAVTDSAVGVTATVADPAAVTDPAMERTGEVSGTAVARAARPGAPTPRVA